MNKTFVIAFVAVASSLATFGDGGANNHISKLERVYNEKFGGRLERPTALQGVIGFVDCGSGIDVSVIEKVRNTAAKEMKFNYRIVKDAARDGLPSRRDVDSKDLSVAVFIVSSPMLPPMLVAPEERWSLVNVSRLKEELPDNPLGKQLFAARCRGEIMRAFALVCGAWTSQYNNNLLTATSVADLDSENPDKMIYDIVQRCMKYLETLGVTPSSKVTYKVACQEGWAPPPTNDVQKAIWDKVHAIPKTPMKIEFDPKKGR